MKKIYMIAMATLFTVMAFAQNFTPGNIVVYRAGDGSATVGNTGTAVFFDEYNSSGTLIQSLSMPTSVSGANKRLVCVGNSTTEGFLTLSTDKQFIVATGYDAATATASLGTSASATVARVVARVDATKTINTTTALSNGFSGAAVRGVCSNNGADFWLSGGNTGSIYATLGGTTATTISGTVTNLRNTYIFDNQLYISTGGATGSRAQKVGTGLPTTTGQTMTSLTGVPTSGSVNGFFLADMNASVAGVDVLYVANDGASTGLQKYITTDGINWTASGNISSSLIRGLTARVIGADIELYATTTTNTIVKFTDIAAISSNISTGSFTTIATATTNTLIKGICFAPELPTTPTLTASPNSFSVTTAAGTPSATQTFNLGGINLTGAPGVISVTPSVGVEVSPDGTTWTANPSTVNVNYTAATLTVTPLYTRIAASAAAGAFAGTVICAGGGSSATINITGGVIQNFYTKPTGDLSVLGTWGIVAGDGTGTAPANFTSPYQIFNVVNRATAVPGAHWEVSGTASKIIVGDGLTSTYLNTSISDTIKATTIVDISNGSGMNMGSRVAPFFGNIGTNTLVNYNFTGTATTDTVKIKPAAYYNLTFNGGLKYLQSGVTIVNNNLVLDACVTNGAPSPFSTVSLKGTLLMTGGAIIEDSTTGSLNRFTLSMAGNNNQTLFIDAGSELRLFRLQRDTSVLTNLNINVTANSKICLGNNTSGGLSLLQKTTGTPTVTKLVMDNNSQLAIVKNGIIYTDPAKAGAISSTNGKIIINKSISSTAFPGTLVFETGSTLSDLTVNITTPTRDSITINENVEIIGNVNLTKGVVVLTPATTITLAAATTITGGSASSYIDGKVRKLNSSTPTFLFPVGQAKQYAPVEMSGLTASSDFTAQYFKQAYTNTTINATTAAAIPGYTVSAKEYWNIDKNGTDNPNIKFYYNTTSLVDAAQARIAHFNTVDWDDIGRDANGTDGVGNYIQKNNVSTFSPFTFGGAVGVLPIVLQSFNGALQNSISTLQWKTACEDAGDAFELQYSTNGINFATIHDINAVGNCNGNTYNYLHKNVTASINYYRLLLKAINGRTKISNILTLKNSKTDFETTLQSTVVKNQLVFSVTSPTIGAATTIISNMLGQQLYNKNIIHSRGTQLNYIPVEKLGSGMYLLTIKNNNGELTTMKFIKN